MEDKFYSQYFSFLKSTLPNLNMKMIVVLCFNTNDLTTEKEGGFEEILLFSQFFRVGFIKKEFIAYIDYIRRIFNNSTEGISDFLIKIK